MTGKLSLPPDLADDLRAYVQERGLDLEILAGKGGQVEVVERGEPGRCQEALLQRGGWIECAAAMGLARRLGIPMAETGPLLSRLEIKIRNCQLGCF